MASYMLCAFFTFELDLAAKGRLEDPERSGGISLLFLVRNCKQNREGGGSEGFGSGFLIVFDKETQGTGRGGGSGAFGRNCLIVLQ